MTITARYASICPTCHQRIARGSRVEWTRGQLARHADCAPPTPSATTPASRLAVQVSDARPCRRCGSYCYGDCTASQEG